MVLYLGERKNRLSNLVQYVDSSLNLDDFTFDEKAFFESVNEVDNVASGQKN